MANIKDVLLGILNRRYMFERLILSRHFDGIMVLPHRAKQEKVTDYFCMGGETNDPGHGIPFERIPKNGGSSPDEDTFLINPDFTGIEEFVDTNTPQGMFFYLIERSCSHGFAMRIYLMCTPLRIELEELETFDPTTASLLRSTNSTFQKDIEETSPGNFTIFLYIWKSR